MEELAKLAGVSKGAVSLALSGKPGIGQDTRERILRIADEVGYTLKKQKSTGESTGRSLRFLVFTNDGLVHEEYYQQPFFRELIHHIEERCRIKGYTLIFSAIEQNSYEQDIQIVMNERTDDGIILLGTNLPAHQISDIADKLPNLVVLDTCFDSLPVRFVEINNFMGAYQAGKYLAELGHQRLGYIASEERIHNFEERKRGFWSALAEYHLEISKSNILAVPPTMLSSQGPLKEKLRKLMDHGQPFPTAFFCECDYIAISTMKALAELGFSIPEDVSVVGFDNINESLILTPELTTVHVEKQQMAHWAVDLLTSLHTSSGVSAKIKIDTRFVDRSSCKRLNSP